MTIGDVIMGLKVMKMDNVWFELGRCNHVFALVEVIKPNAPTKEFAFRLDKDEVCKALFSTEPNTHMEARVEGDSLYLGYSSLN